MFAGVMHMDMIRKILFSMVAVAASCTALLGAPIGKAIYTQGENGYHTYRVPAIVRTKAGTLLAFAEARKYGRGDSGDIDLVVKRSEDGGKTWSSAITVWDDGDNTCGNPSPVVDRKSGKIILLTNWNNGKDSKSQIENRTSVDTRKVFIFFSDDDGLTWSAPREITGQVKDPEWTWYATGPCHSIQLSDGRLVVPCDHGIFKDGKGAGLNSHVIYSDDLGESWHIGGSPGTGDESTVAELAGGDLLLNMRSARIDRSPTGYRRICALSHDKGLTFGEPFFADGLIEPVCNASIINWAPRGRNTRKILFTNPEHISERVNVSLNMSKDNGRTWKHVISLTEGPSSHSDICIMKNGDACVLYECGETSPYETITFARIPAKAMR